MKTINETFTDEEYKKLMRLKKFIKISWHDLLLKVFDEAEKSVRQQLRTEGRTDEEIDELFEEK